MTLGGLAIAVGNVVDNATIFVEIAWRRLDGNSAGRPKAEVLREACAEILPSITFSTVIIMLVFAPVLFLEGLEGQFFRPLVIAFLLVFVWSLVVAVTVVPALCVLLYGKRTRSNAVECSRTRSNAGGSKSARALTWLYRPALGCAMRHPWIVCGVMAAATAAALWMAAGFGTSFLPPFHEDCYTVFVNTPMGTSLDETERVARGAMRAIRDVEGGRSVTRRTGRAEKDEHAEPVSASELLVRVDLARDPGAVRRDIESVVKKIPGVSTMIGYPIAHRISSVLSGTSAELAINIYGDDLPTLRTAALEAKKILDTLPQVADVQANREIMVDTVRIKYHLPELLRAGLSLKDAGEQVSAAFKGVEVGQVAENQRRWDIVVRLAAQGVQEFRSPGVQNGELSEKDVAASMLTAPNGARVRLDEVADVYHEEASNLIVRDNTRRKALISCNVAEDSNVGDLVAALRKNLEPAMHALGCTVGYGGTYEAQQSASRRLLGLGVALMAAILALLTFSVRSFKAAVVLLASVPLCLIGGVLGIRLSSAGGNPVVSVASLVGFVTVIGFVVRNGLLLLNRYRELQAGGMALREAVRRGSEERMVPILMTSLTTIFGLLPIVLAGHRPGGELLAPLAVVQFGGLISATLLNLLVLPAAYLLAFGRKLKAIKP
jgi:HME family heavy-metal exporter